MYCVPETKGMDLEQLENIYKAKPPRAATVMSEKEASESLISHSSQETQPSPVEL